MATEDSHFRSRLGIDWRGVLRAPLGLLTGRDQGGSTIHQQLARVVCEDGATDVPAEIRAVTLAVTLDVTWGDEEILRMYLDSVYFGQGFHGCAPQPTATSGSCPISWTGRRRPSSSAWCRRRAPTTRSPTPSALPHGRRTCSTGWWQSGCSTGRRPTPSRRSWGLDGG